MSEIDLTRRETFSHWARDTARFSDTDRLGHVNNVAFAAFVETARTELLFRAKAPVPAGHSFVIVRLTINFRAEMQWHGAVEIGSLVLAIGRSSVTLGHGVFKDDACRATAEDVMVLFDETTRRAVALTPELRDYFAGQKC